MCQCLYNVFASIYYFHTSMILSHTIPIFKPKELIIFRKSIYFLYLHIFLFVLTFVINASYRCVFQIFFSIVLPFSVGKPTLFARKTPLFKVMICQKTSGSTESKSNVRSLSYTRRFTPFSRFIFQPVYKAKSTPKNKKISSRAREICFDDPTTPFFLCLGIFRFFRPGGLLQ